ncbi:c-type cytochrome [Flavobacteriaceae bacterium]|nr:c-type cytochrome [Flavobacteriaceae bacterium]MDA8849183.1 c-type cytochrome [Flavobacteriaceae bacterium]MDB4063179.1 c-type cytochrome [Flavobacteriaceae bacterium]MDB4256115.1 c-type cytochrome [Flavobacteriaceae bacterium]MDC0001129.1 c-type cytochrome [Flavobacteriaceae bacterium]
MTINRNWKSYLYFSLVIIGILTSITASAQSDETVQAGKKLFNANCAACHKLNKRAVGPALRGISSKYDREWLYSWIKNSTAMVKSGDAQAVAIYEEYNGSVMTSFQQFSNDDIDNIIAYTDYVPPAPAITASVPVVSGQASGEISNLIILVALAMVFIVLVIMLFLVQRTLIRIAAASGVDITPPQKPKRTPLWQAFIQNQFLIIVSVILLLLSSAYFAYGFLMQIGVDQGYMPVQPIHYSHKIHAGANQIECKYCHSSARVSKHSGIPSLNVCMNCHRNIAEYNGEEDLENGYTKDFYTKEIKKLYTAVGWDETNQEYTGESQPVKWVRIHNLPDFVYFNHAQHVEVGEIACQKCHGPVEEMEIMYQYSPLTMGWCINCHRETNVKVENNEYYTKIHEALSKKYGVEKLTVAQMGGLECGKCHY